jgi:hypothetical protein
MEISEYKQKYGEPQTLEEILHYCAFISGQGGLEHRTLKHFNFFVSALIFGKTHHQITTTYLKDVAPESFEYTFSMGLAKDELKIYEKYNYLYTCAENPLLTYAQAFMEYCETEYGDKDGYL